MNTKSDYIGFDLIEDLTDGEQPQFAYAFYFPEDENEDENDDDDDDRPNNGKWMIFIKPEEWEKHWWPLVTALEAGKLGDSIKMARQPIRGRLICVYTVDGTDDADRNRVREALRELGYTAPLHYKFDSMTAAKKSGSSYTS